MTVFAKVVEKGSFVAAARQTRLSPTAVSKHVQALENWLGVRLLNRSTRRIALTEAGEAFHARCTRILAEIDEASDLAGVLQTTLRGRLRVSAPGSFGIQHITPAIVDFMAAQPAIAVQLDLNDRYVDVLGEGYDLAIIVGHLPDSALTARRLAPARFVTCAARSYLKRRGTPRRPEELRNHDCLQYTGFLWAAHEWHFSGPDGADIAAPVSVRFASSTEALRAAVLRGAGILQCPLYAVSADIKAGRLVSLLTSYSVPEFNVYAIHAQGRHPSAKLRAFIDFLARRFGPKPPWDR
ncbi:LysR family transcriptional regulator [Microbacteriaceae bacterium K1510]|nr:LysR family transcriptional regulator [Microbacteriaceae bacterium K1510]